MSMTHRLTKKAYEEFLNERDGVTQERWGNGNYGARTRPYGTYLRRQDPEMFNIEYDKWCATQGGGES
jgi:hypothetical protein